MTMYSTCSELGRGCDRWFTGSEEINTVLRAYNPIRSNTANMNGDSGVEKTWICVILGYCGVMWFLDGIGC